ncbi:hypothetical protein M514_03511, partial [Trichuris suis]
MAATPLEQWETPAEEETLKEAEAYKERDSSSSSAVVRDGHWEQKRIAQNVFFYSYMLKNRTSISSTWNGRKLNDAKQSWQWIR